MSGVRDWLVGVLTAIYRPVEKMALEFWAEANIILRAKESIDNPGPYKRHITIPAARIIDKFMSDPQWTTLIVKKSSQTGFTLHVLILIVRVVAEMQMNIIYAIDSIGRARDISQKRLGPMLEDCRKTRQMISENSGGMKILSYDLPSGALWLMGANSVGDLANKSAGLLAGDELDKWKKSKGEAHPWLLLLSRMKAVVGGKAIGWSTPTEEDGVTHRGHLAGSQDEYHVPCLNCGHKQALLFEQLRFNHAKDSKGDWDLDRVLKETWYECAACKGKMDEEDKEAMLLAGEPVSTNYKEVEIDGVIQRVPAWAPGEMSAWVSDMYSLHPKSTWGKLAVEFIQAQGDPEKLKDFENNRMGRASRRAVVDLGAGHILKLVSGYKRNNLPVVPCVGVMAVDNQGDHQKWVSGAFMPNGDLYISSWGKTLALEETEQIANAGMATPKGAIAIQRVIVDEGGKDGTSYLVRNFCFPRFPRFFPSKGRGGLQVRNTISWSDSKLTRGGEGSIPVCHFDDDGFKTLLYIERIKKFDKFKSENYGVPRIYLPSDITEEFVRELCGENLVKIVEPSGATRFEWQPKPPNDWGDCIKMLYVLWNNISHLFADNPAAGKKPSE
jgi:phage terminase large subunit GpA-like protein